jgi:hypothetical protein
LDLSTSKLQLLLGLDQSEEDFKKFIEALAFEGLDPKQIGEISAATFKELKKYNSNSKSAVRIILSSKALGKDKQSIFSAILRDIKNEAEMNEILSLGEYSLKEKMSLLLMRRALKTEFQTHLAGRLETLDSSRTCRETFVN